MKKTLLGMMSGSSLDGLDLAAASFTFAPDGDLLQWSLLKAESIPLPEEWQQRLPGLPDANALELALADAQFGRFLGQAAERFLRKHPLTVDAVASHGHTVFHYPAEGLSLQIGDGAAIAAEAGCDVIDNFRMQDVSLGGEGAPLAAIADHYLFPDYPFLLNLGGIANVSARTARGQVAFDCTGANQVLNALAAELGQGYDAGGEIAASGRLLPGLLERALQLPYHQQPYPKSLGNDWVQKQLLPLYQDTAVPVADRLHTACRQIARSVALSVQQIQQGEQLPGGKARVLLSGGGAFNTFLVGCIREECEKICSLAIELPPPAVIEYKEAVLMALMGALRLTGQPNTLPSATGARRASCSGAVHRGRPDSISDNE